MLIAFNKPFGTLCQFSREGDRPTLADWIDLPGVYPAGRLDTDSEGLLLLTDNGALQARIADPRHKAAKRYWVQVEGAVDVPAMSARFAAGFLLSGQDAPDRPTRPAGLMALDDPECHDMPGAAPGARLWPRHPPIRVRQSIPTTWLEITLREGRNRQVRRMTAACGHPTLRLVRVGIGHVDLMQLGLQPGAWQQIPEQAVGP